MGFSMEECEQVLGERFFGFGRWDAPYWFIGPEQGQSKEENNDLRPRCTAFVELERDGLCDCREFHEHVEMRHVTKWYRSASRRGVPLQGTWSRLIKILFAYKSDETHSGVELRKYQSEELGRNTGETCMVELSGLPANSQSVDRNRTNYRNARLNRLVEEIKANQPEFALIYRQKDCWDLWKAKLRKDGGDVGPDGVWRFGNSRIGFMLMPLAQSDTELISMGRKLRAT